MHERIHELLAIPGRTYRNEGDALFAVGKCEPGIHIATLHKLHSLTGCAKIKEPVKKRIDIIAICREVEFNRPSTDFQVFSYHSSKAYLPRR